MRKTWIKTSCTGGIECEIKEFKQRVRWTAMCRNGEAYGFQHKPFLTPVSSAKGQWLCTEECVFLCKIKKQDRSIDWKDSIVCC